MESDFLEISYKYKYASRKNEPVCENRAGTSGICMTVEMRKRASSSCLRLWIVSEVRHFRAGRIAVNRRVYVKFVELDFPLGFLVICMSDGNSFKARNCQPY